MRLNDQGRIGSVHFPMKRESLMQPSIHSLLSVVIFVVSRYAVKYNEQLILTLEEDEFSCKQRLAYKLEQVHNIMQGDAQ